MRKGTRFIHIPSGVACEAIGDSLIEEWSDGQEIVWCNLLEVWGEIPVGSTRIFPLSECMLAEEKAA